MIWASKFFNYGNLYNIKTFCDPKSENWEILVHGNLETRLHNIVIKREVLVKYFYNTKKEEFTREPVYI